MGREYIRQQEIISQITVPRGVLLQDAFEGTADTWQGAQSGDGTTVAPAATAAYSGEKGLLIHVEDSAGPGDFFASIRKFINWIDTPFLTFSLKIETSGAEIRTTVWGLRILKDGITGFFALQYDGNDGSLKYRDSSNNWIAMTEIPAAGTLNRWNTIELTINLKDMTYQSVRANDKLENLANVAPATTSGVGTTEDNQVTYSLTVR